MQWSINTRYVEFDKLLDFVCKFICPDNLLLVSMVQMECGKYKLSIESCSKIDPSHTQVSSTGINSDPWL